MNAVMDGPPPESTYSLRIEYFDGYHEDSGLQWSAVLSRLTLDAYRHEVDRYIIEREDRDV